MYSFGCLCWEMYMGQSAHAGLIPAHIIYMVTMVRTGLELPDEAPPGFKVQTLPFDVVFVAPVAVVCVGNLNMLSAV